MLKLLKLFYNSEDNWRKASKRVNIIGFGELVFWITVACLGGTAAIMKSDTKQAYFISGATLFCLCYAFFVVANIIINFNFFTCVRRAKGTSVATILQAQRSLLFIDLLICFLPFAILTKFLFWRGYRKMPKS